MAQREVFTITHTTAGTGGAAETAATVLAGLQLYDWFQIDAALLGPTGDTLDVYLQREVGAPGSDVWRDWVHFPQMAAGVTKYYAAQTGSNTTIQDVGNATTHVLAADTFCGGHPGGRIRMRTVEGASASSAVLQTVVLTCWKRRV